MDTIDIISILITVSALFSYINYRYIKLPTAIGLMAISMALSIILMILVGLGVDTVAAAEKFVSRIDFHDALMEGMLSFLLFAAALDVDLSDLTKQKWTILGLATGGVIISTVLIGTSLWLLLELLGFKIDLVHALLFGALISPTDPIAVMGILKKAGIPKSLEIKVAGESLFNDGVGVVVFLVILGIVTSGHDLVASDVVFLFLQEAVGGLLLGLILGYVCYRLLISVDQYQVEVLLTLALVMGGYSLANTLHLSGPLAMVIAGLMIGNNGRTFAMSDHTRANLDSFWHLTDYILNAVLFVLIGLEVLILNFDQTIIWIAPLAIGITLLGRFISVAGLVSIMRPFRQFTDNAIKIMTWGGLRGGISVALALSIPASDERNLILVMTYSVVVFSILVQGLTIEKLVRGGKKFGQIND
ncbi:MAG: sodium:proton antiporter [Proteobacteria bacterium]|nr:sodium:proton antiporter [Pseudomonadota bacterium]MBU1714694.1 sodium:proton antiporter [Pseudomonadota bacterium]